MYLTSMIRHSFILYHSIEHSKLLFAPHSSKQQKRCPLKNFFIHSKTRLVVEYVLKGRGRIGRFSIAITINTGLLWDSLVRSSVPEELLFGVESASASTPHRVADGPHSPTSR